ncbi:hypothetical protein SEA_POSH_35 [Gordonia phage Posh]|nr:hypothetical protein SEA_POSH_35 [Gordonia phage Posh]UOW93699.1 hypothetical protein SEA_WRIGLEY_36 [Gordonia phage Wrigley]
MIDQPIAHIEQMVGHRCTQDGCHRQQTSRRVQLGPGDFSGWKSSTLRPDDRSTVLQRASHRR